MRILLFPASYPPVLGGLQTASNELARQFQQAGHEVRVATQRYPRRLPAKEVMHGIPVRRWLFLRPEIAHLRRLRPDLFLAGLYYSPVVTRQMEAYFNEFRPEVVNVHFPDEQTPFVLKMRQSIPFRLVVSLHGHDAGRWRAGDVVKYRKSNHFKRFLGIIRSADAVTACSSNLLNEATRLCPEISSKGLVIPNGIDLLRFTEKAIFSHPRPYVLGYGRFNPVKGFDLLLEAFAQAARDLPGIDLILAGDGREKENLHRQITNLAIADRVHFFGQASPPEIVRLLNGSRLVVVPSRYESFGLAALEAMAAGKPVLATRVGGIPEFLPEEGNMLVSPDVDSIARGLVQMLKTPQGLSGVPSNRLQAARFTWEQAGEKYLDIFSRVSQVAGIISGESILD